MAQQSVLCDVSLCTGCKACDVACKSWNSLPAVPTTLVESYQAHPTFDPQTWTYVRFREVGAGTAFRWHISKLQCVHCQHATCEMVCPVAAIRHTSAGFVVIDETKCIGCAFCVETCPFGVPKLDVARQKAYKCWGCANRVAAGEAPACVKTCPTQALRFEDRAALLAHARRRLPMVRRRFPRAQLYGATDPPGGSSVGTLNWFYLLTDAPSAFGLPDHPAIPESVTVWRDIRPVLDGIFGLTVLGVAASYLANLGRGTDLGRDQPEDPAGR